MYIDCQMSLVFFLTIEDHSVNTYLVQVIELGINVVIFITFAIDHQPGKSTHLTGLAVDILCQIGITVRAPSTANSFFVFLITDASLSSVFILLRG